MWHPAVRRKQFKGYYPADKPGGRSHPDFVLQYPSWVTIKQIFMDDVLCTEALVRVRFSMMCTVLMVGRTSTEDLGPCYSNESQGNEEQSTISMFSASTVCLTKQVLGMLVLKEGLGGPTRGSLWNFHCTLPNKALLYRQIFFSGVSSLLIKVSGSMIGLANGKEISIKLPGHSSAAIEPLANKSISPLTNGLS